MTASGSVLGERAIVMGAGMAGLLAARTLSDFFEQVTVVERDRLPGHPLQRKGIPQGRHLHGILSRGSQILEELFPGILAEITAGGGHVLDDGNLARVCTRVGRSGLNRSQSFADPRALVLHLASRPLVEFAVRSRVIALGNIDFVDNSDVVGLIAAQSGSVSGVRVADRFSGATADLTADFVVDAMGRGTRTPALLAALGYQNPVEQRSSAKATYSSQLIQMESDAFPERLLMIVQPGPGNLRCGLMAQERGTWMLTVGRLADDPAPPRDLAAMITQVAQFMPPAILAGLRRATPLGKASTFRYAGAVWRRYDSMVRPPLGLVVVGDALCSLNPIYGQGSTMAGLNALALRAYLLTGSTATPNDFYRMVAADIGPIWEMNETNDLAQSGRSPVSIATNWLASMALSAAENDIALTEAFYRVTNLVDPPSRLRDPRLIARMVWGSLVRGPSSVIGAVRKVGVHSVRDLRCKR
ncbi:MAG: FAD-dependent oxidoreductase [Mycolicibacterium neoaurum]|uniref:FAD-dependent oxidoreductase n=1 Tax=Mycolicibacterium neoaurum TaxID=1795 RepID=UPI002FFB9A6C